MNFGADLTACAALVQKADPERFAAVMASPVAARHFLFPLYAFNVEVARAPWITQEPMIAEMRLQWWRDALEEIAEGGTVRRHEVVTPLAGILSPEDAGILDKLVAARRWDIYKEAFEDAQHFDSYLEDTAGALMQVAARALDRSIGDSVMEQLRGVGHATGLARFLRAVPALVAQNRIPLLDGRQTALASLAKDALSSFDAPQKLRITLSKAAWPAVTEAFLTKPVLRQVVRFPERVGEDHLVIHPVRRSFELWRWS